MAGTVRILEGATWKGVGSVAGKCLLAGNPPLLGLFRISWNYMLHMLLSLCFAHQDKSLQKCKPVLLKPLFPPTADSETEEELLFETYIRENCTILSRVSLQL